MDVETAKRFEADAAKAIQKYPFLKLQLQQGVPLLSGELKIIDKSGKEWDSFNIKVVPKVCYPFCFPTVIEEGGRLPKIPDWHIYEDGSCCFDVPQGEVLKCIDGLPVLHFLDRIAIPFFADQAFRIKEGYYKGREYSHGIDGVLEFFTSKLGCGGNLKTVKIALSRYLYLRESPKKLKNFRNKPESWKSLDKLSILYLKWCEAWFSEILEAVQNSVSGEKSA